MLDERRQRWEQDLRNRQRNIVFPDTVLNEFRGYRFLFSGKTRLTPVLRFCLILLGSGFCLAAVMMAVWGVEAFRSLDGGFAIALGIVIALVPAAIWLTFFFLGIRMIIEGIMPSSADSETGPAPAPSRLGIIRRPFSQRPRQRQLQREKD
jgi:hypothetical protein